MAAYTEHNTRTLLDACHRDPCELTSDCVQKCCRTPGLHGLPSGSGARNFVLDYQWVPEANRHLLWRLGFLAGVPRGRPFPAPGLTVGVSSATSMLSLLVGGSTGSVVNGVMPVMFGLNLGRRACMLISLR